MNYGALGSVIGHEFAHGFSGFYTYDYESLHKIWENDTIETFLERTQCIIEEYDNYKFETTGMKVRSKIF